MLFPAPPAKTVASADVCSTPRRSSRKHKPKVLIVEDHEDTREMLRTILEIKGCQVIEAGDGLEAVEQARRERPDLILMDGSLPLLDGLQATRRIREDLLLQDVFIVALNGWGTPSFNIAAMEAGCDECLVKPLDFELLERQLMPFFRRRNRAA